MDLSNVEVGNTFYGAIPCYGKAGVFLQGWKVKRFLVVRVSDYNIWISYDRHTQKYPQRLLKKGKKSNLIQNSELKVWEELAKEDFEYSKIYDQIYSKIKKLTKQAVRER